jgi:hypothetical protein
MNQVYLVAVNFYHTNQTKRVQVRPAAADGIKDSQHIEPNGTAAPDGENPSVETKLRKRIRLRLIASSVNAFGFSHRQGDRPQSLSALHFKRSTLNASPHLDCIAIQVR